MAKHDGTNCQSLLAKSVEYLGLPARLERLTDAKAVGTIRAGKKPSDYVFNYKEFGAYVECKETLEARFNFGAILPHQMAMAKRCTEGGIHYVFVILHIQSARMYTLPAPYMLWHIEKIRRSYITWDELEPFRALMHDGRFNLSGLIRIVTKDAPGVLADALAGMGIFNEIG